MQQRHEASFVSDISLEPKLGADKYAILGMMTWLWMSSTLHQNWGTELQKSLLLPPIELNQYVILYRAGNPVAFCTWAFLSKEAELAYILDSSAIAAHCWNSGDRLWFVDWIAPFEARDSWAVKSYLREKFPRNVARAIRVKSGSKVARVMEFIGPGISRTEGRLLLNGYLADTMSALQMKQAT